MGKRFFFDRHKACYLFSRKGIFGRHAVQLVGIANHREQLEQKKFYCLLTNQRVLKSSQVLRHYLQRGKIEWFFKMMKSYMGMYTFFRHDPDRGLMPHFEMRCAAFAVLQELAKHLKTTLAQALDQLKIRSCSESEVLLKVIWNEWPESLVDTTKMPCCYPEAHEIIA